MFGLINPAGPAAIVKAIGIRGAGIPASLVCEGLTPDSPANSEDAHNILSIVSAQIVVLSPKSRVVLLGQLSAPRQCQNLPRSVMVEPVPTKNPGFVALVVCDVFIKSGSKFL
jgi:hypothetical protein